MALTDNIVAYWKLDGDSTDAVGSNDGTDTSVAYSTDNGKINNGAGFGGSSRIVLAPLTTATTNFTFSAWVKFTDFSTYRTIVQNGRQSNFWWLRCDQTTGALVFTEDNVADYASSATLATGTWYHIAIVKSGDSTNNLTFYVNGTSAGTASVGTISTPATSGYLGVYSANGSTWAYPMKGAIDEVGIWSRALTGTEITTLYNGGSGLQYPFGATSAIKSINGLAKASIKSINGLAIASIKSINGLE